MSLSTPPLQPPLLSGPQAENLAAFSAISLGVALFVSSYVTNVSVVASIEQTKQDLAGKAERK